MEQKEITLKGKRLFYRSIGSGPLVVLLHGFGEDGTIWSYQFRALPDCKLLIPDLPGSGHSELIEDMSMEGLANAIRELIIHEAAELFFKEGEPHSAIMIGHSMGGYITLAFAELFPQMLRGFGLFHSTAFADTDEKKQSRQKGISFIRNHGAFEFLKTSLPNLYSPLTKEKKPGLIDHQIACSHNFLDDSLVCYYESMMARPDRIRILKQAHVPVLFVLGVYDTAVPMNDGLQLTYMPNLSHIHILTESGHMGMIEESEHSNTILKNYILGI